MGTKEKDGYQIDLIIDRKDATINICELKYYNAPFEIDKNMQKCFATENKNSLCIQEPENKFLPQ